MSYRQCLETRQRSKQDGPDFSALLLQLQWNQVLESSLALIAREIALLSARRKPPHHVLYLSRRRRYVPALICLRALIRDYIYDKDYYRHLNGCQ